MDKIKLAIGADHAGFEYKELIKSHLLTCGYQVIDVGTHSTASCDYPIVTKDLCQKITSNEADKGILVCGTGIGVCITANKVKGIHAALCGDTFSAHSAVEHNNANVLCLGARVIGQNLAIEIVDTYLGAKFKAGRHQNRLDMIE